MKKFLPLILLVFVFQSCLKDKHIEQRNYMANAPVYMTYDQLAEAVKVEQPRELCTPRKIYAFSDYLLINELDKGIHIINNQDPTNPIPVSFLNIPGNVDMSVNGSYLYADSYSDLVTFDISDINNIKEVCRDVRVFEYVLPPHNVNHPISMIDPTKGVVSGWEVMQVTETCVDGKCGEYYDIDFTTDRLVINDVAFGEAGSGMQVGKMEGVSVAGSMARFMIRDNNFYAISSASDVTIYDVTNQACPSRSSRVELQLGIETLFSYGENMFVGAETGMFIYNLSNPEKPEFVSVFEHVESCDPVVVYNDKAYVTTRGTNNCGGSVNQLDVVDISNINNPKSVASYWMTEPYGLGIDGANDVLFVCDGGSGLKVFNNASDEKNLNNHHVSTVSQANSYDVIPMGGHLILIGADGLYQYDYTDVNNVRQLSMIATGSCEK